MNLSLLHRLILPVCFLLHGCLSEPVTPPLIQQSYTESIVKAADLSDDGELSLFAEQNRVCLWQNTTNTEQFCLSDSFTSNIEILGLSANKQYFFTSNQLYVFLYNATNGQQVAYWESGQNIINDIAISGDGTILVLGYRSGEASVINTRRNTMQTFKPHELDINTVDVSADGRVAFTGSADKHAVMWDTATGNTIRAFKHRTRVNHVDISEQKHQGLSLDSINDRFVWNLDSALLKADLQTNLKFLEFNDSAFSRDGKSLLTGSPNRKILQWRTSDGELVKQWTSFKVETRDRASVLAVAYLPDNTIASLTSDGVYEVFALK